MHIDELLGHSLESSNKMAKTFLCICLIAALAVKASRVTKSPSVSQLELEFQEFESFAQSFNKQYSSEQEKFQRFEIFRDNLAYIRAFNSREKSWKMRVNQFADLTPEEFRSMYLRSFEPENAEVEGVYGDDPDVVNWVKKGAVTSVKDQEDCGSCWAFSTTGVLEGDWFIKYGELISLSEQELVNCDIRNGGCEGGDSYAAYEYVKNHGLTSENNYPYINMQGECYQEKVKQAKVWVESRKRVKSNDPLALKHAVAQRPVAVSVDAGSWQFYDGGIMTSFDCGTNLDHAVLAVGYDWNQKYWIVKNSWGTSWGHGGYIYVEIEKGEGACGIQLEPTYATVSKDNSVLLAVSSVLLLLNL